MKVSQLVRSSAVRVTAASVGVLAVGVPWLVHDQSQWNDSFNQVRAGECYRQLHGMPLVNGGASMFNSDRNLSCTRADGSKVTITVLNFDEVVRAAHAGGLPDSLKVG